MTGLPSFLAVPSHLYDPAEATADEDVSSLFIPFDLHLPAKDHLEADSIALLKTLC